MSDTTSHKHEVVTFGCRLNHFESQVMRQQLEQLDDDKEIVVFNSCAVTKEAERQLKQSIRKTKRENPNKQLVVTGCAAQIHPHVYANMPEVDWVVGNQEKFEAKYLSGQEKVAVNDIMSIKDTAAHMVSSFDGKARGFVQVQNGCNHRCTFCIIPYGRGNSRSVPVGQIVDQVKILVDQGYHEVVFTGVDITDYGKDLPGSPSLGQMMRRVLNLVPNLTRLRLSSVDVAEIDEDVRDLIANEPRLCSHFHISLQAGDDMILKRMKRRHTRQDVFDFCDFVRKYRPHASFGADIIAGFPTESDEMFENGYALIKESGISFLHVFPYSPREGTPAAKMPQVANVTKKERAKRLRQLGQELQCQQFPEYVGNSYQAIIEESGIARLDNFVPVTLNETSLVHGQLATVLIDRYADGVLFGKHVS